MKRTISLAIMSLCAALTLSAQEADSAYTAKPVAEVGSVVPTDEILTQRLNDGNQAYVSGDYSAAIEAYGYVIGNGRYSLALYNNLAGAYYKSGQIGLAILYYHRALRISPSNEDVRFNLQLARSQTKDKIAEVPEFFLVRFNRSVRDLLGCTAWSIVSLVSLILAAACILSFFLSRNIVTRKIGFFGFILAVVVFVEALAFALSSGHEQTDMNEAVVTSSAISVKATPDRSAKDLFVLHEGTLVRIRTSVDDWCEVSIADGKKGWVESRSITVI